MPSAKVELFEMELQQSAVYFKALGHPARLMILQFLAESDSCFTGDISSILPLGRTTVNQHLDELKKSGLVQGHISGIKTNYCLNPDKIVELKLVMEKFIGVINTYKDSNCC